MNIKLDRERDTFRPLAQKGAQIYLLISELYRINNMYRFSLAYFSRLFLSCLDSKDQMKLNIQEKTNSHEKLKNAEEILNKIIFNNVASSLFKVDRLSFGLYLLKGVNPQAISER
ncbi:MAG: hypothetical protein E6Q33_10355 [Neisseriales bacterium]|nr:MAG: hypothetical protein E6Q33_10355 [Neisseriales bacterium]